MAIYHSNPRKKAIFPHNYKLPGHASADQVEELIHKCESVLPGLQSWTDRDVESAQLQIGKKLPRTLACGPGMQLLGITEFGGPLSDEVWSRKGSSLLGKILSCIHADGELNIWTDLVGREDRDLRFNASLELKQDSVRIGLLPYSDGRCNDVNRVATLAKLLNPSIVVSRTNETWQLSGPEHLALQFRIDPNGGYPSFSVALEKREPKSIFAEYDAIVRNPQFRIKKSRPLLHDVKSDRPWMLSCDANIDTERRTTPGDTDWEVLQKVGLPVEGGTLNFYWNLDHYRHFRTLARVPTSAWGSWPQLLLFSFDCPSGRKGAFGVAYAHTGKFDLHFRFGDESDIEPTLDKLGIRFQEKQVNFY